MLKHRLMSGVLLILALIFVANYLPPVYTWLLLVAISCLAQLEFYRMINNAGIFVYRIVGLVCGAALISVTFCAIGAEPENVASAYKWEQVVMVGCMIAVFIRQFPQKNNKAPFASIGCTLLGIWYVPVLFNFITRLAFGWNGLGTGLGIHETGRMLIYYLVIVVKASDAGAYFTGMFFGRHKLFPRISPAKTWEGLFGGLAAAVFASCIFCLCTNFKLGQLTLRHYDNITLALLLAGFGVVGDMFESLLKRASGTKDSSSVIPGMGGILDVLDSLLFSAPVLYLYAKLFLYS